MEIYNAKCATAAKPRIAMPTAGALAGVVADWSAVTVQKHGAFCARTTGLPAWSPPTC